MDIIDYIHRNNIEDVTLSTIFLVKFISLLSDDLQNMDAPHTYCLHRPHNKNLCLRCCANSARNFIESIDPESNLGRIITLCLGHDIYRRIQVNSKIESLPESNTYIPKPIICEPLSESAIAPVSHRL